MKTQKINIENGDIRKFNLNIKPNSSYGIATIKREVKEVYENEDGLELGFVVVSGVKLNVVECGGYWELV